jgi:hypothetical protein
LDTQIKRVEKKLTFNIYRKPTATSRYIPIGSHHNIQHKSAAFNSMIHRLVTLPPSPDDAATELKGIKTIAKINGYSKEFVDRIHNKHKKKEELRNLTTLIPILKRDDAPTKRHAITFYLAITNKLQRIFRNHQIDLVYSNKCKLKDSQGNPKDKTEMLQKSGIYEVECEVCDFVLSKINDNQGHSISLDNLKIVKEVRKQNKLDVYESYYISCRKKEGANLMNVAAEKITSRLFDLVP